MPGGENVGVYGINQGGLGLVSANYDLSYQGNNLTITKALLTVVGQAGFGLGHVLVQAVDGLLAAVVGQAGFGLGHVLVQAQR